MNCRMCRSLLGSKLARRKLSRRSFARHAIPCASDASPRAWPLRPPLTVGWREKRSSRRRSRRDNYMLIALLRAEPGSRRILKLAYGKQATPTPTASTRREAIAAGLGLVPVDFDVPITDIPAPSSFHVEVPSPMDLHPAS